MGITALMYAALDGNYAEVEYLLNKGANMNLVCNVRIEFPVFSLTTHVLLINILLMLPNRR